MGRKPRNRRRQKTTPAPDSAGTAGVDGADGRRSVDYKRLLGLVIIVTGFIVYLNSFAGAFVLDDARYIEGMAALKSAGEWWDWITHERRVLLRLSLALNYLQGGDDVALYHVFNMVVHLGAGLALYGVVRRTLQIDKLRGRFGASSTGLALIVALTWLVHPLNTQAVTYIVQRSESLMGMFYLLTLYCAIRLLEVQQGPRDGAAPAGRSMPWMLAAAGCCLLGMMSKESMVTVPVLVFVYDRVFTRWTFGEQLRRRGALYAMLLATGLWYVVIGLAELQTSGQGKSAGFSYEALTWWQYGLTQPLVLLKYLWLSVWPHPLVFDYLHKAQHTLLNEGSPVSRPAAWAMILTPVVVVVAMLGATMVGVVRRRPWAFCAAGFFGALAITSSFIPIADLMVEHRMYLPLAAVAALIVLGGYRLLVRLNGETGARMVGGAVICVAMIALAMLTIKRNSEYAPYEDALGRRFSGRAHLWQTVVDRRPANPRGWHNLGAAYDVLADDFRSQPRYEELKAEALACWEQVLVLSPGFDAAWNSIGGIHLKRGEYAQAEMFIRRAIHINAEDASYRHNLGEVFLKREQWDAAAEQYQLAIDLDPEYVGAYANLGTVRYQQGQADQAIALFNKAVGLKPGYVVGWLNLAKIHLDRQELDKVRDAVQRVLQIDPANLAAREACTETALGYARRGRFDDAIDMLDWAIQTARAARESEQVIALLRRLREEFRAGRLPAEFASPVARTGPASGRP